MFLQPRHELDEVARPVAIVELVDEDALPAVAAGAGRAGEGEEVGASGDTAGGPALDRRGADLLVAQHAEDLAESGDLLLVEGLEGLGRDIAAGDSGASGRDDDVDRGIGDPLLELANDALAVVADDTLCRDLVPRSGDHL